MLVTLSREAQHRGVMVTLNLNTGMPNEIIMSEVEQLRVDLIVMGKMGRKGHRHSLLDSLTERVMEAVDSPVLVISPAPPGTAPPPGKRPGHRLKLSALGRSYQTAENPL